MFLYISSSLSTVNYLPLRALREIVVVGGDGDLHPSVEVLRCNIRVSSSKCRRNAHVRVALCSGFSQLTSAIGNTSMYRYRHRGFGCSRVFPSFHLCRRSGWESVELGQPALSCSSAPHVSSAILVRRREQT